VEGPLPARDQFPDDEWTAKLAIAPGTVYGNRWEQMATNAATLRVAPLDYEPPFTPLPANPRCFLSIRAGGVSLGRVVLELRAESAPLAAENFRCARWSSPSTELTDARRSLCEFGVYKGCILHRAWSLVF